MSAQEVSKRLKLLSLIKRPNERSKATHQAKTTSESAPELLSEYKPRTFYVLFMDTEPHFWSIFIKKGFRHCYVVERMEFIYVMIDPTRNGMNIILPHCTAEHPFIDNMLAMRSDMTALEIVTDGKGSLFSYRPKLLSCVSITQYAIGIAFRFCLTPHGLYKKLIKGHPNIISAKEI